MLAFPLVLQISAPWDVQSIYSRALQLNPSASSALQKVSEARAHVAEMIAQRRLQVTFTGTLSGSTGHLDNPPGNQTFSTEEGTVSVPLPNFGRINAQTLQAEAQLRVAQAGLHRSRLDLAFRSNDAFYGVLRTREAETIAEENLTQAKRQVADAQKRAAAGDIPQADVLKAQVPEAQAEAALAKAKNATEVAELTLGSLIQLEANQPPAMAPAPTVEPLPLSLDEALKESRQDSPDIQEATANVDAAQAALTIANHSRDIDFTFQASGTHTTDPTTYSRLATIGVTFNLPLSDGGVANRQIAQSKLQLEEAKAALSLAIQQSDLSVRQAYLDVQLDTVNVESTRTTLKIAQESYTKAQQSYEAGLTTTRDVLDAGLVLTQARNDANAAVYDLAVARARLNQAIGREPK